MSTHQNLYTNTYSSFTQKCQNLEATNMPFTRWVDKQTMVQPYKAVLLLFSRQVVSDSFVTPQTIAQQAPLSMGFSRQKYWRECLFLLQRLFLTQRSNPHLLHWQADSLPLSHQRSPTIEYYSAVKRTSKTQRDAGNLNVYYEVRKTSLKRLQYCIWIATIWHSNKGKTMDITQITINTKREP